MNPTELEKMVDSSAIGYLMIAIGQAVLGRGLICSNPFASEFVSLRTWYEGEFEGDCPFYLYRRIN